MELKLMIVKQLAYIKKRYEAINENKNSFKALIVEIVKRNEGIHIEKEEELNHLVEEELQDLYLALDKVGQAFEECPYQIVSDTDEKLELVTEVDFAKTTAEMLDAALDLEADSVVDLEDVAKKLLQSAQHEDAKIVQLEIERLTNLVKHVVELTTELSMYVDIEGYLTEI